MVRLLLFLIALPAWAISIRTGALSTDVDEASCSARKPSTIFKGTDRQIFLAFTAVQIQAGDELRIGWVNPRGEVEQSIPYTELPASPALCFISQLPVSGFPASSLAGDWTLRIVSSGRQVWSTGFKLEGDGSGDALRISAVNRRAGELLIDGAGVDGGAIIHVGEFK